MKSTKMQNKENRKIRQIGKDEKIPYNLLLLADETIEAINKYIFSSEIYVLEQNRTIIALYALQVLNGDEIEIKNPAVATGHQGQGIGKQLLDDAVERAKSRGFKRIIIGTGDASTMFLQFYQKQEFEIFGVKKDFFVDNYSKPIYEGGIRLRDMVMLKREL
ncbi:MAG: GNAT family N-acetyltransferase [Candidatus Bathyarchaeota archaeon]|nr:GNAT family N-acetyltransferase [Candidatus Bathyarchaeota archaeon]